MKKLVLALNWIVLFCALTGLIMVGDLESSESSIQIILDSSKFSSEKLGENTKLEVAVNNLLDILETLELNCNLSLRIHGGKTVDESEKCENSSLLLPPSPFEAKKWKKALKSLKSIGEPSIFNAVKSSLADFPAKKGLRKNIILINFSPRTCEKYLRQLDTLNNDKDNRVILHLIDYGADEKTRKELSYPVGATGGTFYMPMTQNEFKRHIIEALELSIESGDFIIETRDFNDNEIYFPYQILESETQKFVSNHETNSIKSVKPGKYEIKVKSIPEKILKNLTIENGDLKKFSIDNFGQLLIKVESPGNIGPKIHYTIRDPETDSFFGSADSGESVFIIEGEYKLTIQTIPFTIEKVKIEKGKKVLYSIRNMGLININVKNKPETIKDLRVVIRTQEDNQYVVSTIVPRSFPMVEGVYKFTLYTEDKITKENIVIKPREITSVTFDFDNP